MSSNGSVSSPTPPPARHAPAWLWLLLTPLTQAVVLAAAEAAAASDVAGELKPDCGEVPLIDLAVTCHLPSVPVKTLMKATVCVAK